MNHLFSRIDGHITSRLKDAKYIDWWCFQWAKQQFTRVALISCMGGHIKSNLKAINETDCLVTCFMILFDVVEHDYLLEGA